MDDYRPSRDGLRDSLAAAGYRVEAAANSWHAIKKMKETPFEIAIIDLDLSPVQGITVSGWDLVRILRAFNPDVAVVVTGAEGGPHVEAQARQLGVAHVLEKPIDPTHVKALITRIG
ncbi:MAG: response regulator [Candidatus Rokubacteria bacterium]|nr:response regulator [Candidatus Rokubacteria bacterium]